MQLLMPFTQFSANTFRHLVGWLLGPDPGFNQCMAALADDSQWCRGIDKLKDALKKGKATTVTWNSSLARNLVFIVAEENDLWNDRSVINDKVMINAYQSNKSRLTDYSI